MPSDLANLGQLPWEFRQHLLPNTRCLPPLELVIDRLPGAGSQREGSRHGAAVRSIKRIPFTIV